MTLMFNIRQGPNALFEHDVPSLFRPGGVDSGGKNICIGLYFTKLTQDTLPADYSVWQRKCNALGKSYKTAALNQKTLCVCVQVHMQEYVCMCVYRGHRLTTGVFFF